KADVGGGIFGITCAYYLSKLGFNVIVLEKDFIGSKTTGHTTGKITSQHGLFYRYLTNSFSKKFAKDYLEANELSIKNIKKIIDDEKINCDFNYQNSYVYATTDIEAHEIYYEKNILDIIGFNNCDVVTKVGLPFDIICALCFKNQAQFNPIKYLNGLCDSIKSNGNFIIEKATVTDIKDYKDFYMTISNLITVKSKYVIIASHYPFINFPGFYFMKMYQSTSYLIGVDTKKTLFNGMYLSASSPTYSFRTAYYNGKKILLIGGRRT
ncbi:MAG: FAD-binding oxidoreductase, partial [Clostridia bacterium]|nr:FAD-binding oxidoreductase [Clostridia bacterium]